MITLTREAGQGYYTCRSEIANQRAKFSKPKIIILNLTITISFDLRQCRPLLSVKGTGEPVTYYHSPRV
jgi:hypothetical protein